MATSTEQEASVISTLLSFRKVQENYCYGETEQSCQEAIESLVIKLREKKQLDDLISSVSSDGQSKKCVIINSNKDGRIVLPSGRCPLPHVLYAKIWMFPTLSDQNEIRPIEGCRGWNLTLGNEVCVNPNHYQRIKIFSNEHTRVHCPNCPEVFKISGLKEHYTVCRIKPSISLLSDTNLALYEALDSKEPIEKVLDYTDFIKKYSEVLKNANQKTESTDEKDVKFEFLQRYIDYENNIDSPPQTIFFSVTLKKEQPDTENAIVTVKSPPFQYALKNVQTLSFKILKKNLIKPQFIFVINDGKQEKQELIDPFDYLNCRILSLFQNTQFGNELEKGMTITFNDRQINSNANLKEFFGGSRLAQGGSQDQSTYQIYVQANRP